VPKEAFPETGAPAVAPAGPYSWALPTSQTGPGPSRTEDADNIAEKQKALPI
jgi:hypothetical protein